MRTLTAAIVLALAASPALASDSVKEVRKTLPLAPDGVLSIETYKGKIHVSAGSAGTVEIVARIEPDGDDADQRQKVQETEVRIDGGGASVHVRSDYDEAKHHGLFGWGDEGRLPFVNYEIRMPATARLKIEDYKSDIRVTGIAGDLTMNTYKGDAVVKGLAARVDVETYKGEVTLELASMSKDVRLETYKGRVEVSLPRDSKFDLDADLDRRGDLSSDFEVVSTSHLKSHERTRGAVNGGGPRLDFSTYKGSLRLKAR